MKKTDQLKEKKKNQTAIFPTENKKIHLFLNPVMMHQGRRRKKQEKKAKELGNPGKERPISPHQGKKKAFLPIC